MTNFMHLTNEQLALRYIDGDNRAFDELLKRTQDRLYNYILCIVKNTEIANDIFQDTFVKVIDRLNRGQYADSGLFQGWIMRIAHNLIMDYFRHNKSEKTVNVDSDIDITAFKCGTGENSISRESEIIYEQTLTDVQKIMNLLPTNQREVVYMRYFQNLSFKEIADITDVSINTALGRMRYAILNMRRIARQYNVCTSI